MIFKSSKKSNLKKIFEESQQFLDDQKLFEVVLGLISIFHSSNGIILRFHNLPGI